MSIALPTPVPLAVQTPQIAYYTQTELTKIYVSGAVLAIAVLVITFYLYKWYMSRYKNWVRKQEREEKLAAGYKVPLDEEIVLETPNKKILFIVGVVIIVVGAIQIIL
jgi:H+/gluconate symporter-like permease